MMRGFRLFATALAVVGLGFSAVAEDIEITVEAGQTVTRSDVISGGKLVKKGGGTLVLTAANTYIGGTELQGGVIEVQNKDALGTGAVTVNGSVTQLNQLKFNVSGLTSSNSFTNDIVFASSSSAAYPALNLATYTYMSGSVVSHGDLYFETGFSEASHFADVNAKFLGPVTIDSGYRIAAAPHCRVAFTGKLSTDILEGYRVDGAAPNGGNHGSFRLDCNFNGSIKKIVLDQTSLICGSQYCCSNSYVTWTGVTRQDGYGYVDINNLSVPIYIGWMPEYSTTDEGAQILNSGSSWPTLNVKVWTNNCYAKFDGNMGVTISGYAGTNVKIAKLYNRTHTFNGTLTFAGNFTGVGAGTRFAKITYISSHSGGQTWFDCDSEDVFPKVTTLQTDSHIIYLNANACRDLSRNRRLYLYQTKTADSTGVRPTAAGTWLDVYKLQGCLVGASKVATLPAGEYSAATLVNLKGALGTVRNWAARTTWTEQVWNAGGAEDKDVLNAANWDGGTLTTFNVPCAWVKFAASGSEATLTNDVHWGGLTFKAESSGFTLKSQANSPSIHLYDNGLSFEARSGDTARTFTIGPQIVLHTNQVWAVQANDKLVLSSGVDTNEFVVDAANLGTITLGGEIPEKLVVNAGKLEIAEGATLPSKFTEISLGAENQLDVQCEVGEIVVDSLKIGGAEAIDGDYTFGNLVIKQRKGVYPVNPTVEAVWDGGADPDISVTTAANWLGDAVPKFDAGLKMTFATNGTTATFPQGETLAHTIAVTNLAENGGPTSFTLKGTTTKAEDTVLKLYGKMSANNNTWTLLKNITVESSNGVDTATAEYDSANAISIYSATTDSSTAPLKLSNAVIKKPIAYRVGGGSSTIMYMCTYADTTNVVMSEIRKVDVGSNWTGINIAAGSSLTLAGGVKNKKSRMYCYGDLIITNKPWNVWNRDNGITYIHGNHAAFNVASNDFGYGNSDQNGLVVSPNTTSRLLIDLNVSYAIYDSRLNFEAPASSGNTRLATVDLHCTTQRIVGARVINFDKDDGNSVFTITGEPGSLLILDNKAGTFTSTNVCLFTGGISLKKEGVGDLFLNQLPKRVTKGLRTDATTTGKLLVTEGNVIMGAGFSWRNGPVAVSGGTLKISEANQLGRGQTLTISTDDASKLDIAEDVTLTMSEVYLGNAQVSPGTYHAGTEGIEAHLFGSGTLRVAAGTYFIIK